MFILSLASIVNASNYTKCISLSNQKCEGQPTPIKLHLNEYTRELHYFPFAVKLDRCVGSCSTLNNLFNKVCVPNKTENLNTYVFYMITGKMNQKFQQKIYHANVTVNLMEENVLHIKSGITINIGMSIKSIIYVKKDYIWNPATYSCKNDKYVAKIIADDSMIKCDEIVKETKTIPKNFNEKKQPVKQNFFILLAFLSVTMAFLIAVSIYCYLINVE